MPSLSSWYVTNGIGEVSERKGVPVRARRRAEGSKASLRPSPQERESPAWWISSMITSVRPCSVRARCSSGFTPTCA